MPLFDRLVLAYIRRRLARFRRHGESRGQVRGLDRIRRARLKHGRYSKAAIAERVASGNLWRSARALLERYAHWGSRPSGKANWEVRDGERSIIDSGQEPRAEILDYGGWPSAV